MTLRLALAAALVLVCATSLWAQGPSAYKLVVDLRTDVTAMAFDLPPELLGMVGMAAPRRSLSAHAVYRAQPVPPLFLSVPADLGQPNNRVVLVYHPPTPAEAAPQTGPVVDAPRPTGKVDATWKWYWRPGQAQGPITLNVNVDLSALPHGPGLMAPGAQVPYVPGGIEPTATGGADEFPAQAVGRGNYTLNTGGLQAVLDGFLPGLQMVTPRNLNQINLSEGIPLQWQPVPGARGFIVHARAMMTEGDQLREMISWVSTQNEPPERVRDGGYEQATTIADDLAAGILLPPNTTQCLVPPGIFPDDPSYFTLTVTAVGNDFYSSAQGVTVRGRIRSSWTAMKLADMEGMGGWQGWEGDDEEGDEDAPAGVVPPNLQELLEQLQNAPQEWGQG